MRQDFYRDWILVALVLSVMFYLSACGSDDGAMVQVTEPAQFVEPTIVYQRAVRCDRSNGGAACCISDPRCHADLEAGQAWAGPCGSSYWLDTNTITVPDGDARCNRFVRDVAIPGEMRNAHAFQEGRAEHVVYDRREN